MYEEAESFEIIDYTTATDLERFISDLENILKQWNLCVDSIVSNDYSETSSKIEELEFRDMKFKIQLNHNIDAQWIDSIERKSACPDDTEVNHADRLIERLQDDRNDFKDESLAIDYTYGTDCYITIEPCKAEIFFERTVKLLLSAVTIVCTNVKCVCPIFVRNGADERELHQGVFINSGIKFSFEMAEFKVYPVSMTSLYETCHMFKEKINCSRSTSVNINAKFTFDKSCPTSERCYDWSELKTKTFDAEDLLYSISEFENYDLPRLVDLSSSLQMSLFWFNTRESILKDSIYFTNLTNLNPDRFELKTKKSNDFVSVYYLIMNQMLYDMSNQSEPLNSFKLRDCTQVNAKSALNQLVQRETLDISFVEIDEGNFSIDQKFRTEMLNFVFTSDFDDLTESDPSEHKLNQLNNSIKSCPNNSVTWRVCVMIGFLFYKYRNWKVISVFWRELLSQFRRFLENNETIPDVELVERPDFKHCDLHQTLQLLNCCIQAKQQKLISEEEEFSDEFYDYDTSDNEDQSDQDFCDTVQESYELLQPEGVLREHESLELLHSNTKLNIPITQDAAPMTEEMLEEQSHILIDKQSDGREQAEQLRHHLNCSLLLSDMQAFKAANPGCCFEDFIRWYSPNDFVCDSTNNKQGALSTRFKEPNNVWRQLWSSAYESPLAKQKSLFDHTKVAESILHKFDTITVPKLVKYILPVFVHFVLKQLASKASQLSLNLKKEFDSLVKELNCIQMQLKSEESAFIVEKVYSVLLQRLLDLEQRIFLIHEWHSLLTSNQESNLTSISESIVDLLNDLSRDGFVERTPEDNGQLFDLLRSIFLSKQASESIVPIEKEFYLRTSCPRPSIFSRDLFQGMHCIASKSGLRISGCFTEDLVYY